MSDARSLQALQRLVQRESRSLMQYVFGAYPWTTVRDVEARQQLLGMIEAERDALVSLTHFLTRHKIQPPRSGGYPTDFTSLNFVDLGYLSTVLAERQQDSIAKSRDDLGLISDEEGRRLAQALLDLKVHHLDALRKLKQPEPAVMP